MNATLLLLAFASLTLAFAACSSSSSGAPDSSSVGCTALSACPEGTKAGGECDAIQNPSECGTSGCECGFVCRSGEDAGATWERVCP